MADLKGSTATVIGAISDTTRFLVSDGGVDGVATGAQVEVYTAANLANGVRNQSAASQSIVAATLTLVNGTLISIPASGIRVGSRFTFKVWATKALVGTTGAVFTVRVGTAGTTADAAVLTTVAITGTAVADQALFTIEAVVTAIGATASMTGSVMLNHGLTTTGWATAGPNVIQTVGNSPPTSATFNSTTASLKLSLAINSPFACSITQASVEAVNL